MTQENINTAVAYYNAVGKKDIDEALKYLDSDIHLISPIAEIHGKNIMMEAIKGFMASFNTIHIRAKLSNKDNAMLVIDVNYLAPLGFLRTASFLTIQNDLITKIELFHDTKQFEKNNVDILA